jgi:signal transduction histidine kinase
LQSLKERNLIIQDEQKKLAVFRHDLRHNYRLIAAMLNENKIQKAIDFISKQDELLRNVDANDDLPPSILHSVISIYRKKAQELSIKFYSKINLPLNYNSGDITILLTNLLDNAINFNKSDSLEKREIILSVSYDEDNIFIEIANRFNEKVILDENGLPRWKFGNGMKTLLAFRDKHLAKIKFIRTDDRLNILIYFRY